MNCLGHILIGLLLLSSYFWIGNAAILIAVAYVAVDIDHIQILIKEKAFSFNKIKEVIKNIDEKYDGNPKNAFDGQIFILHSVEFVIMLLILAYFFYPRLYFVALGASLHIITDIIHHLIRGFPIIKWLFLTSNLF